MKGSSLKHEIYALGYDIGSSYFLQRESILVCSNFRDTKLKKNKLELIGINGSLQSYLKFKPN